MNLKRGFLALAAMILGVGFFGASPANADTFGGITCTAQDNGQYPSDGTHYFMCISNPTAAQTSRMESHYLRINGFPDANSGFPNGAREKLEDAGVKFYYFRNKTEHNSYMNAKHGSGVPGVPGPFDAGTSRCGHTHGQVGTIYSSVFDTCTYQSFPSKTNPNVVLTAKHEGGHAWTAALGKLNGTSGPARSAGFNAVVNEDKARFDTRYNGMNAAGKKTYICGLFGNVASSTLEKDLGAVASPAAVCTGVGSGAVLNFPNQTPTQIANQKLPYFVNLAPLYEEWWAEKTVLSPLAGGAGTPDILPITNKYLGHADAICSRYVMSYMWQNGVAPPQNSYPSSCTGRDPNTIK